MSLSSIVHCSLSLLYIVHCCCCILCIVIVIYCSCYPLFIVLAIHWSLSWIIIVNCNCSSRILLQYNTVVVLRGSAKGSLGTVRMQKGVSGQSRAPRGVQVIIAVYHKLKFTHSQKPPHWTSTSYRSMTLVTYTVPLEQIPLKLSHASSLYPIPYTLYPIP